MNLYDLLVFVHVLSAILSIGPYLALLPMISIMKKQGILTEDFDRIFRFVVRLTMHAGHVLIISGLLIVWLGPWSWTSAWLILTMVILLASGYFIARAFSPSLKKLRAGTGDPPRLVARLRQSVWIYLTLMTAILWLMAAKPMLW